MLNSMREACASIAMPKRRWLRETSAKITQQLPKGLIHSKDSGIILKSTLLTEKNSEANSDET